MIRRTQLETKEQKIAYMETKMSRPGIARIIVFSVILILLAYFSVGYTYETFNTSLKQQFIDVDDINNINIDGSDFTPGFRILGTGINSFLALMTFGTYAIVILVVSAIFIVPFRFIGLRKNSIVTDTEKKITKAVFAGAVAISIIVSLIITRMTMIVPLLIYTAMWAGMAFCIYVLAIMLHRDRGSGYNDAQIRNNGGGQIDK